MLIQSTEYNKINLYASDEWKARNEIQIFWQSLNEKLVICKHTVPYIALKLINRMDFIIDTYSAECTWKAFHVFYSDKSAWKCNVQRN